MSTEAQDTVGGDLLVLEWIRNAEVDNIMKKYNRAQLTRLAQKINIDVNHEWKNAEIAGEIKLKMLGSTEISVIEQIIPGAGIKNPNDFEVLEGDFGLRCTTCGEIPVVFAPGFDPRHPLDSAGVRIPCFQWPFKFRGYPSKSKEELFHRSREDARCAHCESVIPFEGAAPKSRVNKKNIVQLKNADGSRVDTYPLWEALMVGSES